MMTTWAVCLHGHRHAGAAWPCGCCHMGAEWLHGCCHTGHSVCMVVVMRWPCMCIVVIVLAHGCVVLVWGHCDCVVIVVQWLWVCMVIITWGQCACIVGTDLCPHCRTVHAWLLCEALGVHGYCRAWTR